MLEWRCPACLAALLQEHNDTLLAILLSTVTKGAAACNEIVDKVGGGCDGDAAWGVVE